MLKGSVAQGLSKFILVKDVDLTCLLRWRASIIAPNPEQQTATGYGQETEHTLHTVACTTTNTNADSPPVRIMAGSAIFSSQE